VTVNVSCDKDGKDGQIAFGIPAVTDCNVVVTATSNSACPAFSITQLFTNYSYIFAIVFIAAGLFITFFGSKLFPIVLFIVTAFVVAFVLIMFITQVAFSKMTPQFAYWIVVGVSAAVGLTVAYFISSYKSITFAIVGACGGGVIGLSLSTIILSYYAFPVYFFGLLRYFRVECGQ
jgi:hypothetical protein